MAGFLFSDGFEFLDSGSSLSSWSALPLLPGGQTIIRGDRNPAGVYLVVGTSDGMLYTSSDDAKTWALVVNPMDSSLFGADNENIVWAGSQWLVLGAWTNDGTTWMRAATSPDLVTWTYRPTPFDAYTFYDFFQDNGICATKNGVVVALTKHRHTPDDNTTGHIMRSLDAGNTWELGSVSDYGPTDFFRTPLLAQTDVSPPNLTQPPYDNSTFDTSLGRWADPSTPPFVTLTRINTGPAPHSGSWIMEIQRTSEGSGGQCTWFCRHQLFTLPIDARLSTWLYAPASSTPVRAQVFVRVGSSIYGGPLIDLTPDTWVEVYLQGDNTNPVFGTVEMFVLIEPQDFAFPITLSDVYYQSDSHIIGTLSTEDFAAFDVATNGSEFVLVGKSILYSFAKSSDGLNYVPVFGSPVDPTNGVQPNGGHIGNRQRIQCDGNNRWVTVGPSVPHVVATSDFVSWDHLASEPTGFNRDLIWDGQEFVAVGDVGPALASTKDGINWTVYVTGTGIDASGGWWIRGAPLSRRGWTIGSLMFGA